MAAKGLIGQVDEGSFGLEQADLRSRVGELHGSTQTFGDDPSSGDLTVPLGSFPAGSRVTSVSLQVGGRPFSGRVANLEGAKVLASPVLYSAVGTVGSASGSRAYILDLGGVRSILGLSTDDPAQRITLVLPWMGTDFGPMAAFPVGAAVGSALPTGSRVASLTGIETTKVLIQVAGSALPSPEAFAQQLVIALGTYPTNVRASIDGRLPFWTKPGALSDPVEPVGLAEELSAVLASAPGAVSVQLSLTADAPGVFEVTYDPSSGIAADRTAAAKWGGSPSTDVALPALEPLILPVPFPTRDGGPWAVAGLTLDVTGAFPPWRAYQGQATADPGALGLRVDAGLIVARRFAALEDVELHGISMAVRTRGVDAQVHVEAVAEDAGAPGAGPALAAAEVMAAAPAAGAGATPAWIEALFAKPIHVRGGTAIWIVAKAKTGSIEWAAAGEPPDPATRTMLAAEGGRWERYPSAGTSVPVAQIRVLRTPLPNEHEPALTFDWPDGGTDGGGAGPAGVEPGRAAAPVDLTRAGGSPLMVPVVEGNVSVPLRLLARSRGTITITSAIAVYRDGTA